MDKKKRVKKSLSLFGRMNSLLEKYSKRIFWCVFSLTLLFAVLLFDIRFSFGGDDSAYVIRAFDFIHHFIFPGFQGPLYPIVLSPFVGLFGINAIPLKSLSIVFMLGFISVIYIAFRKRIPSLLLVSMLSMAGRWPPRPT